MRHPRSASAFTLAEALTVVLIIGIVLPIALSCISLATRAASLAKQKTQALEIANNQMNLALAQATWQNGDQQGDLAPEADGIQFHWATHIQDWDISTVHELHVDVTWPGGNQTRTLSLVTLIYDGGNAQ